MNRVLYAMEASERRLKEAVDKGQATQEEMDKTSKTFDFNQEDLTMFKIKNSQAAANGDLNHEESMTVYALLQEGTKGLNKRGLGTKLTLTQLMVKLMSPKGKEVAK